MNGGSKTVDEKHERDYGRRDSTGHAGRAKGVAAHYLQRDNSFYLYLQNGRTKLDGEAFFALFSTAPLILTRTSLTETMLAPPS
jgi:hypothetical protein